MKLKLNLPVPKTSTAIPYYHNLFGGTIIKDGLNDGHAYIKIFDKLSLHIHSVGKVKLSQSYFIIRFDNNEKDIFNNINNHLKTIIDIEIKRYKKEMVWETTLTEFKDKYGYNWVLEINT